MEDNKSGEIKKLVAKKVKELKGDLTYDKISRRSNTTAARISDVANNKIDCQLSTLIDIAIGLRVHPKDLFDIDFNFKEYFSELDGK